MHARKPDRITLPVPKRKCGKHRKPFRLIVPVAGEIEIRDGTHNGHPADLIEAPAGTKIERPRETG